MQARHYTQARVRTARAHTKYTLAHARKAHTITRKTQFYQHTKKTVLPGLKKKHKSHPKRCRWNLHRETYCILLDARTAWRTLCLCNTHTKKDLTHKYLANCLRLFLLGLCREVIHSGTSHPLCPPPPHTERDRLHPQRQEKATVTDTDTDTDTHAHGGLRQTWALKTLRLLRMSP
jgi:hypothetical protein